MSPGPARTAVKKVGSPSRQTVTRLLPPGARYVTTHPCNVATLRSWRAVLSESALEEQRVGTLQRKREERSEGM